MSTHDVFFVRGFQCREYTPFVHERRSPMRVERILAAAIMGRLFASTSPYGQWPETKTPRIPRLADGKPDLSAPAPRGADGHPDLSGVWDVGNMTYFQDLASGTKPGEVQLTPWAAGIQKQRRDATTSMIPTVTACLWVYRASTRAARSKFFKRRVSPCCCMNRSSA